MRINFSSWQPLWGPEDPAPWYPQVLGPFCPKVLHMLFLAWESLCPLPSFAHFFSTSIHLQCFHTASTPHHSTGLAAPPGHTTQLLAVRQGQGSPVPSPCPHL